MRRLTLRIFGDEFCRGYRSWFVDIGELVGRGPRRLPVRPEFLGIIDSLFRFQRKSTDIHEFKFCLYEYNNSVNHSSVTI